jgi:hypothetical protein
VRVGADHHAAGERVVLQHHLVDDARAGLPEPNAVLVRNGGEEVIDLLVRGDSGLQVGDGAFLGLDQVVTVNRRRHECLRTSRLHELEQRHLRRRILHRNTIRREVHVVHAARVLLACAAFPQVPIQDLLRQCQRAAHHLARRRDALGVAGVDLLNHVNIECHCRSLSSSCVVVCCRKNERSHWGAGARA